MSLSKKKLQTIAKAALVGAANQESPALAEAYERDYKRITAELNEKIDDLVCGFRKESVQMLQELHPLFGPGSLLSATQEASNRMLSLIDPVSEVLYKFKDNAYRQLVAESLKSLVDLLSSNISLRQIATERREKLVQEN